jgi:hypothetical protein
VALSKRALLSGVLHALASDPPKVMARVCRQLSLCVLAPQAGALPTLSLARLAFGVLHAGLAMRHATYVHTHFACINTSRVEPCMHTAFTC